MPKTTKSAHSAEPKESKEPKSSKESKEPEKQSSTGRVGWIIALVVIIVAILGAIIASVTHQPSDSNQVWDSETTLGNADAKNYFVVYSDLACPYCIAFENAIVENEEIFQKYLAQNDILFEVRLSDVLYLSEGIESSRLGAIASFCAKNEGKFWDYYNHAISSVWNGFFKDNGKEGGVDLMKQDKSYWANLGRDVGLGDSFASCVENEDSLPSVQENTEKVAKLGVGMPYFKFNDYTMDGFSLSGDWNDVLNLFQLGLES